MYLAGAAIIISFLIAIERRHSRNRVHLALYSPVIIAGGVLYLSAVATMFSGDRVHGVWLVLTVVGGAHILIFNFLISCYMNTDSAIHIMNVGNRINIKDGRYYFNLPDWADSRIGLPQWLHLYLWASRIFFIAVCVFGAIVFGPGLYSSVGAYERLLNGAGTVQLGMGVLLARLWHFPLAVAVQRKFENLPADEKYLKVD
ncbi:hypothetical protein [Halomonas cupida]|uniref:hypothetical protein n=1 Tax=Halomonas cupida TaxID=44933 RepID=UPI003A8F55DB